MLTALLDVNVLLALLDREHIHFRLARDWFAARKGAPWATCPLTENGAMRIMGHYSYPGSPGSPYAVAGYLEKLVAQPGHVFWPGAISLLDAKVVSAKSLLTSAQLTDTYLLALARSNGGVLATLDRKVVVTAVTDGAKHLELIA